MVSGGATGLVSAVQMPIGEKWRQMTATASRNNLKLTCTPKRPNQNYGDISNCQTIVKKPTPICPDSGEAPTKGIQGEQNKSVKCLHHLQSCILNEKLKAALVGRRKMPNQKDVLPRRRRLRTIKPIKRIIVSASIHLKQGIGAQVNERPLSTSAKACTIVRIVWRVPKGSLNKSASGCGEIWMSRTIQCVIECSLFCQFTAGNQDDALRFIDLFHLPEKAY
jgi:hypothetical protein